MNDASRSSARRRRELVAELALAMVDFGACARGRAGEPDLAAADRRALLPSGLIAAIGGELLASIGYLAADRWAYAGAALVRQLVEVEYLAWAVTNDPGEAWAWWESDRATRLQYWAPSKIRKRAEGRFPNTDYFDHCEIGGHPVAKPAISVLDHRDDWVEINLYEACVHGSAAWHYLLRAVDGMAPIASIERHHELVDAAYAEWRAVDELGERLREGNAD